MHVKMSHPIYYQMERCQPANDRQYFMLKGLPSFYPHPTFINLSHCDILRDLRITTRSKRDARWRGELEIYGVTISGRHLICTPQNCDQVSVKIFKHCKDSSSWNTFVNILRSLLGLSMLHANCVTLTIKLCFACWTSLPSMFSSYMGA